MTTSLIVLSIGLLNTFILLRYLSKKDVTMYYSSLAKKNDREPKASRRLAEEDYLEIALTRVFPNLNVRDAMSVLDTLNSVDYAKFGGRDEPSGDDTEGASAALQYRGHIFLNFPKGHAYYMSKELRELIETIADRTIMPNTAVVAAALHLFNKWTAAQDDDRIRPLFDSLGNPLNSVLIMQLGDGERSVRGGPSEEYIQEALKRRGISSKLLMN